MKRVIRRGIFETNSSSTHSVSIVGKNDYTHTIDVSDLPTPRDLVVDSRYNKVITHFGEFGWGPLVYNDPEVKLSYLITMVAETEAKHIDTKEQYFETEGFKLINDTIASKLSCDGVLLEDEIDITTYDYINLPHTSYIKIDGYIDHQSYEPFDSLKEFLDHYDVSIEDFIFDSNCLLFILNDNSYDDEYDGLLKTHVNEYISPDELNRYVVDHPDMYDEFEVEMAKQYLGITT
jgi:hypothetical protein